ncbi:hypothetical protein [Cochleicola gelatinilyticus]|uniref:Uncharacterized protein n=1 Tax=Cochleicola gelatinilyticus TaxID=1763537 RepID=A0A167HPC4_9FLAO|nr:hypothetical protein [Cochleicola gelatinilyticus]OAB78821.1 hypothetical protein ULVI_09580 [Cochleicola gelatinilyticus]
MSKPKNCITPTEAKQLQENWMDTRALYIKNETGSEDVSNVFYTVEELEEYLTYVKNESKKQGIDSPGIRIYFAAYNDSKSKKATVFLAPTEGDAASSNTNYKLDPLNKGVGGWPPAPYKN